MKIKNNREKTRILFLEKETVPDKETGEKYYVLTCQNVQEREITNKTSSTIWFEKTSKFDDTVKLLGRLSELMEKYDIKNLDFLDSLLELFRSKLKAIEYGDETRFHFLKYFNTDFAFFLGTSPNCAVEIGATDYERLKMFLPKENQIKMK